MLYVLDSTVLIDYLRGRPVVERVLALQSRRDVVATTAINVEEIVRGLRNPRGSERVNEFDAAARLFAGLNIVPVTAAAAWRAGTWRRQFADSGRTIWQADCLVAACAVEVGGVLVTGNPKDFPIPELELQHWPVGE